MNLVSRFCPVFLLSSSLLMLGCNPPGPAVPANQEADHDDHDHGGNAEHEKHESYAEAVKELDGLRLAVKNAMAENNMQAADEAVHEIGHILEELPGLAAKQAGGADDTLKPAIDELFDCFDQIDQKLEGGVGKTYDELSDRIDVSMATLRARIKNEEK